MRHLESSDVARMEGWVLGDDCVACDDPGVLLEGSRADLDENLTLFQNAYLIHGPHQHCCLLHKDASPVLQLLHDVIPLSLHDT